MEEGMRKVVSGLFISLDGVVETPNQWQSSSTRRWARR
jgi:hypothetical protein